MIDREEYLTLKLKENFEELKEISNAYLYGSSVYSWSHASDIDILFIASKNIQSKIFESVAKKIVLDNRIIHATIISLDELSNPFFKEIQEWGIQLW